MIDGQFWAGVFSLLALEALIYFLYTRYLAAQKRKETRKATIFPTGSTGSGARDYYDSNRNEP